MTLDPTAFRMTPAPGRDCGTCTLCCKVYEVPVLEKPAGTWCRHCTPGRGCGIHETRPEHCRAFFCLWMTDGRMPDHWKPERSKIVMSVFPSTGFIHAQVDPGAPQAWRKEPYLTELQRFAADLLKERRHVIVFVGSNATLIMPTGPVPMGHMSPEEGFVVRPSMVDDKPGYAVERVPQAG